MSFSRKATIISSDFQAWTLRFKFRASFVRALGNGNSGWTIWQQTRSLKRNVSDAELRFLIKNLHGAEKEVK